MVKKMVKCHHLIMMILVLWNIFICTQSGNTEIAEDKGQQQNSIQEYRPFTVLKSLDNAKKSDFVYLKLPSQFLGEGEEFKLIADESYVSEISLCPDIRHNDKEWEKKLLSLHKYFPTTASCLFVTPFEDKRPMCTKEPPVWLDNQRNQAGEEILCGDTKNEQQMMISSEYNNCGTDQHVIKTLNGINYAENFNKRWTPLNYPARPMPMFSIQHYVMYEICYDFKYKRTVWTRHKVMTPELLAHKNYPYNRENKLELEEFKTNKFDLDLTYTVFFKQKEAYELTKSTMKAYTMVPKAHMALPYWKKATTHFINSAPLLPKFVSLMEAIHNGIFLASHYFRVNFNETLRIYTKADTIFSTSYNLAANLLITDITKNVMPNIFQPNTWYMFVHNESNNSGILIVLHNIGEVNAAKIECDVREQLHCKFSEWSNEPESVTEDILKFAYCCPVSQEMVKKLYAIENIQIDKDLNLQEAIDSSRNMMKTDE